MKNAKLSLTYQAIVNDPTIEPDKKKALLNILLDSQVSTVREFLKAREAAKLLSLSKSGFYNMVRSGLIRGVDIGNGLIRYRYSDLQKLGEKNER
jgi:excisionase family DNA binding protein